ncbi:MAG: fumarylacetoacetate hydrolase family protein, partial [Alphaproteobacteria bacterium]|nr:fumarylacetoacetate hydrolase family protein [Alphaproteobacteria bacterium]
RILCVGANYVAHALEMGRDPSREPPFFFAKPTDAIINADRGANTIIPYPPQTNNFHYEMEMVVTIGKIAENLEPNETIDVIWGYGAGIDLTRRDLQKAAKDKGRPWELGKGFDKSAIISSLCPVAKIGHPKEARIWLSVNDVIKQDSNIDKLIWSVPEMISILSKTMTLLPGDVIYTGTPEGVGPIVKGDKVSGGVEGIGEVSITIS